MKIEPVFEETLQIGKFYSVPTVYGLFGYKYDVWPVLGPMHDDKEVIGFPYVHYHYDFRFFNSEQWAWAVRYSNNIPGGEVMSDNPTFPDTKPGPVIFSRRKYQRAYPKFPLPINGKWFWLPALQEKYKDAIMKDLTCPHKGASLRGLPVDKAGCVTCPLHGLKWNVETGQLALL